MDATPTVCPECGGTAHVAGECHGLRGYEEWSHHEIRDHFADPEDNRKEPER